MVRKIAAVVEVEIDHEPKTTRRSKAKEAEEAQSEPTAKVSRRSKAKEAVEKEVVKFNPLSGIDDEIDLIEKSYSLTGSSLGSDEDRQHTGLLELDLILGKGIKAGWYTFFGAEQSCKSTGASTWMTAALNSNVPIIQMWDYEGSSSPEYIENIMEVAGISMPIEQVFGIRDPKTQKWAVKPRVRYYSEGVGERFFDSLARLQRALPDKMLMNDQWYYVYDGTKANRAIVGEHFDKNYWRKTGKYRIEAENGGLQALLILDSYPAMLPEKQDVDDPGSAMAVQARMFSDQIKRVKGKLKAKCIAVVGVNQLRKAPMVAYGSPDYEPGGEALKYFSDVRLRMQPRVMNAAPGITAKGAVLEEKSITGGVDTYRFIHVRAHKNKLSVPNLEGWLRLWITDSDGEARGFDPVYDTWRYLANTGQCGGKMNAIKLEIDGHPCKRTVTWMQFKKLVLGSRAVMKEVYGELDMKPFHLRKFCIDQLHLKDGIERYFKTKQAGVKSMSEKAGDEESSSGEDED